MVIKKMADKSLPDAAVQLLDLTPYTDGGDDSDGRAHAATAMDAACRGGNGFVAARLPMAGVNEDIVLKAFLAAKELFDQPEEVKLNKMRRLTAAENYGYIPLVTEIRDAARDPGHKEAFHVKKDGNDFSGCPPGFAQMATALWDAFEAVANGTCECAADALGLGDTSFFTKTLAKWDQVTLAFLHYPPCDWAGGAPPVRCRAHSDFGLFTFLFVLGGEEGLQIKGSTVSGSGSGPEEGWRAAAVPKDAPFCIINTGELAARWTDDNYSVTTHRVFVPSAEAAGRHRYSIGFFVHPDSEAVVETHPSMLAPGQKPKYAPTTGKKYLIERLYPLYEDYGIPRPTAEA